MRASFPIVAVLLASCASMQAALTPPTTYRLSYDYGLSEVVRPAKARERYGPQRITSVADTGIAKYLFEDDLVRVIIYPSHDRIHFSLANKTTHSVKIAWNESAFVGVDGTSQPVMHVGVRYTECAGQKAPSVIIQQGRIDDAAIPCKHVTYFSGTYTGGWYITPLIPSSHYPAADTASQLDSARTRFVGQKIRFLLPIQVEDVTNDYLFTFEVKSVKPVVGSVLDDKVP
jgi:hypothetical protein